MINEKTAKLVKEVLPDILAFGRSGGATEDDHIFIHNPIQDIEEQKKNYQTLKTL